MQFKYVVAIIRPDSLEQLEARFASIDIRGMTVTQVKGLGGYVNFFSRSHLVEHIKIEIFVEESKTGALTNAIIEVAGSDVPGAGVIAVLPVEQFFHVRTGSEALPEKTQ